MNSYELRVKGKVVEAPPKELELLNCLASHPNRVYTRDQLLDEVWGFEYYGDSVPSTCTSNACAKSWPVLPTSGS